MQEGRGGRSAETVLVSAHGPVSHHPLATDKKSRTSKDFSSAKPFPLISSSDFFPVPHHSPQSPRQTSWQSPCPAAPGTCSAPDPLLQSASPAGAAPHPAQGQPSRAGGAGSPEWLQELHWSCSGAALELRAASLPCPCGPAHPGALAGLWHSKRPQHILQSVKGSPAVSGLKHSSDSHR